MVRNQYTHPWTKEQIDILYKYYPDRGSEEVVKHLKDRTRTSIQLKCSRLGIKTNIQGFRTRESVWTKEEIKNLKKWIPLIGYRKSELRETIGTPYISEFLPNRTIISIQNQVRRLRIFYNPQEGVKEGYHRCNLCLEIKEKDDFSKWCLDKLLFQCKDCEKKITDKRYESLEYRLIKSLDWLVRNRSDKNISTDKLRVLVHSLLNKYDYECHFKDEHCDYMERIGLTVGHKYPVSRGGDVIDIENLFFICMGHNVLMSTLSMDEFIPSLKSMNKRLKDYFSKD